MKIYLVGIGMGDQDTLTIGAKKAIEKSTVLIGAERMIKSVNNTNKTIFTSCNAEDIRAFICGRDDEFISILLSGDVGFYSGAKKYSKALEDFDLELIPGISSAAYFCARLGISMDDVRLCSLHGQKQNIIQYIKYSKRVFALLSGSKDIRMLCQKLCHYGMGHVVLHIGQRLSYKDECIVSARADSIQSFDFDNLCVVLAENDKSENINLGSIDDDCFVRGDVPMTKSEVRSLSIAKLKLQPNSVLYDIGAGTGSVAVEAAQKILDGTVYAIEKNENALELIQQNKTKFAADNINIVRGTAPAALCDLPVPTHAFIGGSGGNMEEIITTLYGKNPNITIVVNAIALNTLGDVLDIASRKKLNTDIVCINAAKCKRAGSYQMMMAQNPVYIITLKNSNQGCDE